MLCVFQVSELAGLNKANSDLTNKNAQQENILKDTKEAKESLAKDLKVIFNTYCYSIIQTS